MCPTNRITARRPRCEQTYRLSFSDGEWHRVEDWLKLLAESALYRVCVLARSANRATKQKVGCSNVANDSTFPSYHSKLIAPAERAPLCREKLRLPTAHL